MTKESSSREDDIKREFNFATHSIISQVLRGVLVGIFAGLIVGIFRFLIEKIFHLVQDVYHWSQQSMLQLLALISKLVATIYHYRTGITPIHLLHSSIFGVVRSQGLSQLLVVVVGGHAVDFHIDEPSHGKNLVKPISSVSTSSLHRQSISLPLREGV